MVIIVIAINLIISLLHTLGKSDDQQLETIFKRLGTPNENNFPGYHHNNHYHQDHNHHDHCHNHNHIMITAIIIVIMITVIIISSFIIFII